MSDNWDPLSDLQQAASDVYDTYFDPIVDEAEEAVTTGLTLLEEVGKILTDNVSGVLEEVGLDPGQLASEWDNLSDQALQAIIDFLKRLTKLTTQMASLQSLITQSQATFELPLQEKMSASVMPIFVSLQSAIRTVTSTLHEVLAGLQTLIDMLPEHGFETEVNNVDPRFTEWLQGKGLPTL